MTTVAALYHFTRFDAPSELIAPLRALCEAEGVKGILLLAKEGINGTIAGPEAGVSAVLSHIQTLLGCAEIEWKLSHAAQMPFTRMKVREKSEIVTMGQPNIDPTAAVGNYVAPDEWNALIQDPDVVLIDTRNAYETAIGTFEGAIDPKTESFRDFPEWWQANKKQFAGKRVAMFCTGGIRCEKSTNYLLQDDVKDVFHLKGGILKYLETIDEDESLWNGSCFVFDERVSVEHGLKEGPHELCRACRRPILPEDKTRVQFEQGVSCHHCIDETTDEAKLRFRERQKQIRLSAERGETHFRPSA